MYLTPHSVAYSTVWQCSKGMVLFLVMLIVSPILWSLVSMFYCALLFVLNSFAIILVEKRKLVALLCLISVLWLLWLWLFLKVLLVWLWYHAHMLFFSCVALRQQAESHYFLYNLCFILKFSKNECQNSPWKKWNSYNLNFKIFLFLAYQFYL